MTSRIIVEPANHAVEVTIIEDGKTEKLVFPSGTSAKEFYFWGNREIHVKEVFSEPVVLASE